MKVNKSSDNCLCSVELGKVCPDNASHKSHDYQRWLAKVANKLGLCCVGLHK
ncbi:hypothetical protein [Thalassomonas sp. RHCl1]|uniref:hypothetical protein n=1 Tax=Thalassomonas sp. RHCl1 TaxID=2995320 RepID=UPI00248D1A6A|nr:hypothetical protein [Thalassomonas sp. RHCl1]